jgi:hypothetical protein
MVYREKYYIQIHQELFEDLDRSVLRYNSFREPKFRLKLDYLVYFLDLITRKKISMKNHVQKYVNIPTNILNPLCCNRWIFRTKLTPLKITF